MTTAPVGYAPRPDLRHTAVQTVESTVDSEFPLLHLPMPGHRFRPDSRCATCRRDRVPAQVRRPPRPSWRSGPDEESLAWFRWLLGHHLATGVWRVQRELLTAALDPGTRRPDAIEAVHTTAALYRTYSTLLLYSGSCTPAVYARVIRTRMMAWHPAFSGTWARDHEHVSALLRQLKPLTDDTVARSLRANRLVHMAVAKRLVPVGRSLLRQSGGDPRDTTDGDRDCFDEFFRISRDDVCRHSFATQLTDRILLARADIAKSPLAVDHGDDELHRLQADLPAQLAQLASMVSEWKETRS
ncbi:MAG TPA: L-tyrosine 3-hydroxylase [Actinophytocola sp.]|uniref:L-tyrosine 3-hydroxylase n=1 Tax=Actinophytocola sp. TaxID=1872138 RepID=UPI002E087C74|nr:L-tyrosine 3-hydroxylase [Actinophytocola sp.]